MRHDTHFVEAITSGRRHGIGRMVEIERVDPNPHQPRKDFGDLADLVQSVKEKGILEPILVRAKAKGRLEIIAGERRYQAGLRAGLSQVPILEIDVDDRGALEISLIENLQRKDLTSFEEAAAIQRLCDDYGYTHEQVARSLGRSRIAITELLALNRMPAEVQEACRRADNATKSTNHENVRQPDTPSMLAMVKSITEKKLTRDEVRDAKRRKGQIKPRGRNYVYNYRPDDRQYSFSLRFRDRKEVDRVELIRTLQSILEQLVSEAAEAGEPPPRKRA
jgi:ParB family chromosome partitioning protein